MPNNSCHFITIEIDNRIGYFNSGSILININKFTDCHSYQADVFENWNLMQTLFLKLFDKKIKIIFDKYYSEYTQIRRELKKDKNNL